jgi:hypothetical protein
VPIWKRPSLPPRPVPSGSVSRDAASRRVLWMALESHLLLPVVESLPRESLTSQVWVSPLSDPPCRLRELPSTSVKRCVGMMEVKEAAGQEEEID